MTRTSVIHRRLAVPRRPWTPGRTTSPEGFTSLIGDLESRVFDQLLPRG